MSEPSPSHSGLSRRTVVRTAAHSAWAAPLILAATAAPAFALSSPALITTTVSGNQSGTMLTVTVALTNANTGAAGQTTLAVTAAPFGRHGRRREPDHHDARRGGPSSPRPRPASGHARSPSRRAKSRWCSHPHRHRRHHPGVHSDCH